jgi:hypothetical protein
VIPASSMPACLNPQKDTFRENYSQYQHFSFWPVFNPGHIARLKIVENRDIIFLEKCQVIIEVFTFERICNNRFVLNTGYILIATHLS